MLRAKWPVSPPAKWPWTSHAEQKVARKSAFIYLPIALGAALLFWLAASLGNDPLIARIGGTVWVWLLTLIVALPLVTARVKRWVRKNS